MKNNRNDMTTTKTQSNEGVTCPTCGHIHDDSSSWDDTGTTHCDSCGQMFAWEIERDYEYTRDSWHECSTYYGYLDFHDVDFD